MYICNMNEQKEKILMNIWEMFFQYGIKSVTMDDIASKLGISKKTLYQHFPNKKELVTQACEWERQNPEFSFNSDELKEMNALDQYFEFFKFVNERIKLRCDSLDYDLKKYYPEIWNNFKQEKIIGFQNELLTNLKKGVKEGFYRSELNIDFISKNLVSFYLNLSITEYQVFNDDEVFNADMHRELTMYHLHGICTKEGIKYFKNKFK
ncbi:TetR family transcriptional regulator [Marinifilum sp. N1E240]|uniref:TetR/AcrR family transcriptional regulator n=1 Tax=Marinifilum sp. N1E240 TaxID=2608082 RepID=UPI00128C4763|nr:TetR/AcrR family transcriptional regulator [Marinifilum sp. N1E240]MPQ48462.1 TetR family transcriptional regulator [Marinifilum sp. N1E240]